MATRLLFPPQHDYHDVIVFEININIRFQGLSVWNSTDEDIKSSSLPLLKKKMKQPFIKDYKASVHRFCNSKIRNNAVLQCKTFSHFDILVVYLILLIFIFVCIYGCLFLCPWPHHLNIFSFNWLPGMFNF